MIKPTDIKANAEDPEETLVVATTGIVDDARCISDLHHLAKKIVIEMNPIDRKLNRDGKRIRQIIVAGPPCIASYVSEYSPDHITVTYNQHPYRKHLDDGSEAGGGYNIPAVIEGQLPMARKMEKLSKYPNGGEVEFSLHENSHRTRITGDIIRKLDPERYRRARKKAQSKRFEQITNDWYDNIPGAEHAIILHDWKNSHDHLVNHAEKVESSWVKYPTGCDGTVKTVQLNGTEKGCISWVQAAVFDPRHKEGVKFNSLSNEQLQNISQSITEATRQEINFPRNFDRPDPFDKPTKTNTTARNQNLAIGG
jgi:hypothetical protein